MKLLLFLFALVASTLSTQAASFPEGVIPDTACVQLKGGNTTQDFDDIKAAGIKFVRRGFHWDAIEKTKGTYDFSADDVVMKELRDRGLRVLAVIAFGNKLYQPVYNSDDGRNGYAQFAAALAAHYKDDNVIWEIWNEPDTMTFWGKHGHMKGNSDEYAGEYVNLVKATVPAMRQADPNCTIVAGSVSGIWSASLNWTEFCFEKGILASGIDGWSVHPYSVIRPEDYPPDYEIVRDMMAKNGAPRDFPILDTERGFPVTKAEGYAGGDPAMNQQYQAWNLVRQYLMDTYAGIKLTNWYEWSGADGDGRAFGIDNGHTLNLAGQAYKVVIAQLSGYRFDKRLDTTNPLDYVLAFSGPGGAQKIVAWTSPEPELNPTTPPSSKNPKTKSGPDQAVPHSIDLPVSAAGTLPLVQLDGTAGTVDVKNGTVTLSLTGAPQYLSLTSGK